MDEIEKSFAEIDAGQVEEPTVEDAEDPADTVTLEEYKAQRKSLVETAQYTK